MQTKEAPAKKKVSQEFTQQEILKAYQSLMSLEDSLQHLKEDLAASDTQANTASAEPAQMVRQWQKPMVEDRSHQDFFANLDMRKVGLGVRRRLWFILFCGLAGALLFSALSFVALTTHQAEAVLLFSQNAPAPDQLGIIPSGFSRETMVEMIRLPQNLQSVKASLGLELSPEAIGRMVDVQSSRASNVIRIVATADNPELAQEVANELARVSVDKSKERYYSQALNAFEYLKEESTAAQSKFVETDEALAQFKKEAKVIEMDLDNQITAEGINSGVENYHAATLAHDALAVEYDNLRREIDKMPDQIVRYEYEDSPLKARIAHRELALIDAKTKYGPENPRVLALQEEIKQLRRVISDRSFDETREKVLEKNFIKEQLNVELMRLHAKLRAAKEAKEALAARMTDLDDEFESVPEDQLKYAKLRRTLAEAEQESMAISGAMRMAEQAMESERSDIEVQSFADKATPKSTFAARFLPSIGFIVGGALGLFFVLIAELRDRKFRTGKQVRANYNIPYLLSVPEISGLSPQNAEQETLFFVRNLSERLSRQTVGQDWNSVVFTSAKAGEGKTTLAYHLALYHKRLGQKVAYVDFDSRSNPYAESTARSIEDYLKGDVNKVDDLITKGPVDYLKAGYDSGMKELVKGDRMMKLWQAIHKKYDFIVVDAPGIIEDDYAVNLCSFGDQLLYVIGSTQVTQDFIDASLQELDDRRISVSATVMTRMHPSYIEDPRIKSYWSGKRWNSRQNKS